MTGKSDYNLTVRHGTEDFDEDDFEEADFWTRASGNKYILEGALIE